MNKTQTKSPEYSFYEVGQARELVVPSDFHFENFIKKFKKKAKDNKIPRFYVSDDVTPEKYPHASHHFTPGMRLGVTVMGIDIGDHKMVRISKCIKYLVDEGAVLTNLHGLVLAFELAEDLFAPAENRHHTYYGLDVREMLPFERLDTGGKYERAGYRHPSITIPPDGNSSHRSLGHTLTERFGKLSRFLKFEVL